MLGHIGPAAASSVPTLVTVFRDDHVGVRSNAIWAVGRIGAGAAPAAHHLLTALAEDPDEGVRLTARRALESVVVGARRQGTVLWWIVPRAYGRELFALLVALVAFFLIARRFPRTRPTTKPLQVVHLAAVALIPTLIASSAVYYATTRQWAQGFIPDPVLTVLPFPVAAVLSVAFVCVLAAIWACQRKSVEGSSEPERQVEPQPEADTPQQL